MNKRENLISLYRRKGYQKAPVSFSLCPSQMKKFHEIYGADANPADVFGFSMREIGDGVLRAEDKDVSRFQRYYTDLKPGPANIGRISLGGPGIITAISPLSDSMMQPGAVPLGLARMMQPSGIIACLRLFSVITRLERAK